MNETGPQENFRPFHSTLAPTGLPPQSQAATGIDRALKFARSLTTQGIVLAAFVFGLQATMKEGNRPSDLIGGFHGSTTAAQLDAERRAQMQTAQGMANAQSGPPANWQMEQQLAATQQQAIAGSLESQQTMANLADLACFSSGFVGAFFGRDGDDAARELQRGCGAGDRIRDNMNATLAKTIREGSGVMQRGDAVRGLAPVAVPLR
jgi:hypothetical protein